MAFAHGKIILLGEHAAVYGRPALVASIARGVKADAKPADTSRLLIEPWHLEVTSDANASEPVARAFANLLQAAHSKPVEVRAEVALPGASGLGCSAALGVAIAKAICEANSRASSDEELMELANLWEKTFHENPSGIDVAAALLGSVLLYKKGEAPQVVAVKEPKFFVVGHSGETSDTKDMVAQVARQYKRDPKKGEEIFDAISSLALTGKEYLSTGKLSDFGQLMDMNHSLLNSLMLCTKALDEMCSAARKAGALGAKLTGAGGGGCMIALASDEDSALKVQESLRALKREAFVTRVPN